MNETDHSANFSPRNIEADHLAPESHRQLTPKFNPTPKVSQND